MSRVTGSTIDCRLATRERGARIAPPLKGKAQARFVLASADTAVSIA